MARSPREDTMICMDTSEWMRNGDYPNSRMQSQYEAIEALITSKKNASPENMVGLVALSSQSSLGVELICSLTPVTKSFKVGKAAKAVSKLQDIPNSTANLVTGLKVAKLAFNFRPNQNIPKRIVVFLGSPLNPDNPKGLAQLANALGKNKVSVDIVCMGENDFNRKILAPITEAANPRIRWHAMFVEPGNYVDEALSSSEIAGGSSAFADADDPELAEALRISWEEAQRERGEGTANPPSNIPPPMGNVSTTATVQSSDTMHIDPPEDDELMREAKLMSLAEAQKQLDENQDNKDKDDKNQST
eukprot:snap_masked-scaffold_13-processed-gene-7.10-mRNA-1 protein AED:1.00 eAED:1.00 QI:0/-1/0/0/-1/1/1/0/303